MNVTRSFLNNMISKKDADLAVGEAMKQGANEGYKQGVVDGVKETVSPNNVAVKKNHYKQQAVNTISAGPNGVM